MAKRTSPVQRSAEVKKENARVQRKYKTDLKKRRKLIPQEESQIKNMIVVLKLASYSQRDMAMILGISKGQVKAYLDDPGVQEDLNIMGEALPAAALELMHGYMIEAVQTVAEIMRHAEDDKIVLQAAAEILDRGGIPKASRQERLNENNENITISDDGLLERLREASPEIQEQAAQLVEGIEELLLRASGGEVIDEEGK